MDALSTANTTNLTSSSNATQEKKAPTQSKATEFSSCISEIKTGGESLTCTVGAEGTTIKDKTDQKILRMSPVEEIFQLMREKIRASNITAERKTKLGAEAENLYQDFKTIKQAQDERRRFAQIYIMEGATGVQEDVGRPSSDPDENMALASIVFLTKAAEQITFICVPDGGNRQHTLRLIEELGGKAEVLFEHEEPLEPGVIYISSMVSKEEMSQIGELTKDGREITVLGPPFGEAYLLVKDEDGKSTRKVNIMGAAKIENGKFIGISTNTREEGSESFFIPFAAADVFEKLTFYSSSEMGKMTILFEEYQALRGTALLLTPKDTNQWVANTGEQFLGAFTAIKDFKLPGSMLVKRLDSAKILPAMYGENAGAISNFMREDPGRRLLGFERFLEASQNKLTADTITMDQVIITLEMTVVDWTNESQMKQFLKDRVGKFQEHTVFKDVQELKDSYQKCLDHIDRLCADEAKAVLISILSAFKNVYEEKTVGGWQTTTRDNGKPWEFANFERSFNTKGKQVPYDTLVVYAAALGKPKLDANDGDKALLVIL